MNNNSLILNYKKCGVMKLHDGQIYNKSLKYIAGLEMNTEEKRFLLADMVIKCDQLVNLKYFNLATRPKTL